MKHQLSKLFSIQSYLRAIKTSEGLTSTCITIDSNEDERVNKQLLQEVSEPEPLDWIGNQGISPTDEANVEDSTPTAEFMRWHFRLGHTHFKKMRKMAKLGFLPKKFSDLKVMSKCKVCQFGKQVCLYCRVKGSKAKNIQVNVPRSVR